MAVSITAGVPNTGLAFPEEHEVAVSPFILGSRATRLISPGAFVIPVVILAFMSNGSARADKLTSMLTPNDLAHPIVLDGDGQVFSPATRAQGTNSAATTPTYVAYALMGGEHLASDLTTLSASTSPSGSGTGPFQFTSTLETSLDSALSASGSAIVQTANQQYLVAYLPRYTADSSGSPTSTAAKTATSSSSAGILGFNNINGISFNKISQYLNAGSNELTTLSTSAVNDLGKLLSINNAERSAKKPSLNLELHAKSGDTSSIANATTAVTSSSTQEAQVLEVPAPEPGTWILFSVVLGTLYVRRRARNKGELAP